MKSPVLLLVFNRPAPTRVVLQALRSACPGRLYIAADGPRPDRPDDVKSCSEVRRIADEVDWDCEVRTLFRDSNLGCRRAVTEAITWFFEHEDAGVILEDDCVPSLDFFRFCDFALDTWRDDARVMHVGGHVLVERDPPEAIGYSRLVPIWGWATWGRAWDKYDPEMNGLPQLETLPLRQWYGTQAPNVLKAIRRVHDDHVDAWGARWVLSVLSHRGLSVLPGVNLISNIGFGSDATHTKAKSHVANLPRGNLPATLRSPAVMDADPSYDERYLREMNRQTFLLHRAFVRLQQAALPYLRRP